jgi:hypothetical protein
LVQQTGAPFYWLAIGFHRFRGHQIAGCRYINAVLGEGGLREAILAAVTDIDNATNGQPRTVNSRAVGPSEDMRRSIGMLLDDPEWGKWSSRAIAKQCRVSQL